MAKVQASTSEKKKAGKEKPKEVTVLDPKVLQNVGIALAKYRMAAADIKTAILKMNENKLDIEKLASLYNLRPTSEDLNTLRDFPEAERPNLGKVEKFFLEIMDIPRYDQRLECFIFKRKFESSVEELEGSLQIIADATKEAATSKRFVRLLEVVLKLGNFLNGGTGRGGSYGFRLDSLNKLATIKSVDNKRTLMNYLVSWSQSNDPELLDVDQELLNIPVARRHPLTGWQSDFKGVKKAVELIKTQISAATADRDNGKLLQDDCFIDIMQPFYEKASCTVDTLESCFGKVKSDFEAMVASYGEDPSTSGLFHPPKKKQDLPTIRART